MSVGDWLNSWQHDFISQDPTAVTGLGYFLTTGRAGFFCFHRCYKESESERRRSQLEQEKLMTERHRDKEREAGGGKILPRVCKNNRWIGQEPGLQTSIFLISVSLTDSTPEPVQADKKDGTHIHAVLWCGPWSGSTPEKELKGAAETEAVLSFWKSTRGGREAERAGDTRLRECRIIKKNTFFSF